MFSLCSCTPAGDRPGVSVLLGALSGWRQGGYQGGVAGMYGLRQVKFFVFQ
jgi:hypothetical protein